MSQLRQVPVVLPNISPQPPSVRDIVVVQPQRVDVPAKTDANPSDQSRKVAKGRSRETLSAVAQSVTAVPELTTQAASTVRKALNPSHQGTPSYVTIATVGGAIVLGAYILKSYREGGIDVDGSGTKRSVFKWVDAACGALIAMMLVNFARTVI